MTAEFDRHAAGYDGGFDNALKRWAGASPDAYIAAKVRWLLRHEPELKAGGFRLLDYGCGVGDLLRVLAAMGARGRFIGCDVSAAMLEEAVRRWPEQLGLGPSFVQHRNTQTAFGDGAFDVAVASAVLHHVPPSGRRAVFAELGRVLRPGGRLVVFEHNPRNPLVRHVVARTPIDRDARLLDAREVRQGLAEQGFRRLKTAYLMFTPPRLVVLQGLDRALFWLPLGAQYAVSARKPVGAEAIMDRKTFEAKLKRDGYDVMTSTTAGAKTNPEHSHPFDVRALVLKGALTLHCDGAAKTYGPNETFSMPRGCLHSESYGSEGAVVLVGRKV